MNEDINREILNELRKSRRVGQAMAGAALVMLGLSIGFLEWRKYQRDQAWNAYYQARGSTQTNQARSSTQDNQEIVWPSIAAALDRGDNQRALSIAQNLVTRQPRYHYSYATLGCVYVAIGDMTNAEAAYMRAIEL